jgi:hypothetical protein
VGCSRTAHFDFLLGIIFAESCLRRSSQRSHPASTKSSLTTRSRSRSHLVSRCQLEPVYEPFRSRFLSLCDVLRMRAPDAIMALIESLRPLHAYFEDKWDDCVPCQRSIEQPFHYAEMSRSACDDKPPNSAGRTCCDSSVDLLRCVIIEVDATLCHRACTDSRENSQTQSLPIWCWNVCAAGVWVMRIVSYKEEQREIHREECNELSMRRRHAVAFSMHFCTYRQRRILRLALQRWIHVRVGLSSLIYLFNIQLSPSQPI